MSNEISRQHRPLRLYIVWPILSLIAAYFGFILVEASLTANLTKWGASAIEIMLIGPILLWTIRCIVWTSVNSQKPDTEKNAALPFVTALFMQQPARTVAEGILGLNSGSVFLGVVVIAITCSVAYYYSWINEQAAEESWHRPQSNP